MTRIFALGGLLAAAPALAEPASFVLGLQAGPTFAVAPLDMTVLPRVTLGVELPPAQRRFRLWGSAAWQPPRRSGDASDSRVPGGSFDYELMHQELIVGGGVAFAITNPEGPVVLDLELGPQAFLFESKVKRAGGVKDSGTLCAAAGGVLDVVDSLLFTVPLILVLWPLLGALA